MKNEKHTQGEWMAKEGQVYPCETGKTLALIPYFDNENEEDQANQKLIAAAPEMLESLKIVESTLKDKKSWAISERLMFEKAVNAINKATL